MTERKYEFTEETITTDGTVLHRIRAIRNFGNVKKGDLGGFIEKEDNLSHLDDAWIYGNARVYGNAEIFDNVRVFDGAWVYGEAWIYDNAKISGNVRICGDALIHDDIKIYST